MSRRVEFEIIKQGFSAIDGAMVGFEREGLVGIVVWTGIKYPQITVSPLEEGGYEYNIGGPFVYTVFTLKGYDGWAPFATWEGKHEVRIVLATPEVFQKAGYGI